MSHKTAFQTVVPLRLYSLPGCIKSICQPTLPHTFSKRNAHVKTSPRATAQPPTRPPKPESDPSKASRDRVDQLVSQVTAFQGDSIEERRRNSVQILNALSELPNNVSITPVYHALVKDGRLPFFGHAPMAASVPYRGSDSRPIGASSIVQDEGILNAQKNDDVRPVSVTAPMQDKAVLANRLEEVTGVSPSALSPRRPPIVFYQLGAIAGLWLLAYVGRQLHISNAVRQVVVAAVSLITIDQVALGGVIADRIYSSLNPSHVKRVVTHEAGHFLLAYLHGLPVQRYALSAWDAVKNRVPGQAATLFADDEFAKQLQKGRVTASTVDRYSVVAMGGIAAEGMILGEALGGDSDINAMVRLLAGLQPAWEANTIRIQAKWAVLQAVLLLREYRPAYDALRSAMEQRRSLGECITCIEDALVSLASDRASRHPSAIDVDETDAIKEEVQSKMDRTEDVDARLSDVERKQALVDEKLERIERGIRESGTH